MNRPFLLCAISTVLIAASAAQPRGWAPLGDGLSGPARTFLHAADGTLHVGQGSPASVWTWDGAGWDLLGADSDGGVAALAFASDGRLYAGGGFDQMGGVYSENVAVWDGVAWDDLDRGVYWQRPDGTFRFGDVLALLPAPGGGVYVGGFFNRLGPLGSGIPAGLVARWDGQAWSAVGGAGLGHVDDSEALVRALAYGPDGRLFVGGEFTTADGEPVANVAVWDGTAWDGLAGGLPGEFGVTTLAFGPDGRLYAGGLIGQVGDIETDLAAWDGTAWAPVGPAVPGSARALAFTPDGRLYVGGSITLPDGTQDVARLDGYLDGPGMGTWVGLGGGVTHPTGEESVSALAVGPEGEVYVGGFFNRVWQAPGGASVPANNVAVWWGDATVGGEDGPTAGGLALSVRPNPSRGATTVSVTLASSSAVRVVVVDVLGREVAVVHGGPLAAGTHALAVDVSRWPAGVYGVRVVAGEASSSAHLTVVP